VVSCTTEFILIVQFEVRSNEDFDLLLLLEQKLQNAIGDLARFDGRDWGAGEMNIFIYSACPDKLFTIIREILERERVLPRAKIAYRRVDGEKYTALWPAGFEGFRVK